MDEPTRRAWSRPELIVLVRGGPEEAVLTACKDATRMLAANNAAGNCRQSSGDCSTCNDLLVS